VQCPVEDERADEQIRVFALATSHMASVDSTRSLLMLRIPPAGASASAPEDSTNPAASSGFTRVSSSLYTLDSICPNSNVNTQTGVLGALLAGQA